MFIWWLDSEFVQQFWHWANTIEGNDLNLLGEWSSISELQTEPHIRRLWGSLWFMAEKPLFPYYDVKIFLKSLDLFFGLYLEVPLVASVSRSLPEQSESAALILQTGHHFRTKTPVEQMMGGCAMFPILSCGFQPIMPSPKTKDLLPFFWWWLKNSLSAAP